MLTPSRFARLALIAFCATLAGIGLNSHAIAFTTAGGANGLAISSNKVASTAAVAAFFVSVTSGAYVNPLPQLTSARLSDLDK